MSGGDTLQNKARIYVEGLPGKRGKDIPEELYDRIFSAASGITQQIWGRPPTPHQMQYLFDNGHHTPDKVKDAYGSLPHPHADGLTVGEYPQYLDAYEHYKKHR